MAEDKDDAERSEDPSQKKQDDAHTKGDVVKSQEVNTWFVLAGGVLALFAFGNSTATSLKVMLGGMLGNMHAIPVGPTGVLRLTERLGIELVAALAVPLLLIALAALVGNMIQHRLVWSAQSLAPKFSKISPLAGIKRLFSKLALVNFVKGLVKLALIGSLMVWVLWPERDRLFTIVSTDPAALMPLVMALSLKLLVAVAAALLIVAGLDYFYQYQVWYGRQKMSLRELKEEYKQSEGDPHVKGKIKQIRQARMRKRMIADVPKASVIITNPTHFAVALQYERGMSAPICVAKGVDALALKIREVATAHNIPIVENPPLARALHATVEVDDEVPPEHYKAVAEVIGYVMKLRRAVLP